MEEAGCPRRPHAAAGLHKLIAHPLRRSHSQCPGGCRQAWRLSDLQCSALLTATCQERQANLSSTDAAPQTDVRPRRAVVGMSRSAG